MDSPPHMLSEDDLVAAAFDPKTLSAEAQHHLAQCPTCARHVTAYRQMMSSLTTTLYRWDCPDTQEISDYAAGLLRGKRRRALTLHLRRCTHCTQELEISRQFLAPTPFPAASAPFPAALRQRFIALLVPQRAIGLAPTGLRGGSSEDNESWPRQYHVEHISLSLHRAASSTGGSGAMLLGLISRAEAPPDSFTDIEVRLIPSDTPDEPPLAVERIDDLGNFVLSPIPTGRFDLLILLPEGDLVIEGLELSG
jgi:hypothetical protein